MARRSTALESLSANQLEELEADIMRAEQSWRGLSSKFKVPETTLRQWADKKGIVRNPTGLKRQLVETLLSRPDPALAPVPSPASSLAPPQASADSAQAPAGDSAPLSAHHSAHSAQRAESSPRADIEAAAAEDVRDMRFGLQAARAALMLVGRRLQTAQATPGQIEPRDIKVLSECVALNVGTIRLIRGLDVVTGSVKDLTDEQLEALAKGKAPR